MSEIDEGNLITDDVPFVVSVVLNWNNYEDTKNCLNSLQEQSHKTHEILVVDNGSTDGSDDQIESEFPNVTVLRTGENLGFGEGMNHGIEWGINQGADYLWILNNDTLFPDDVLDNLVEVMETCENIGVLSPRIHKYPETETVWFERGIIESDRLQPAHVSEMPTEVRINEDLVENDYIPLCCALVKSTVIDEVSMLSDEYFLYYEDVDFGIKVRRAGFKLVTHEASKVLHRKTASTGGNLGAAISYYKARNRFLFTRNHGSLIDRTFLFSYVQWFIMEFGHRLINGKLRGAKAFVEGILDGVRGRTGRGRYP